MLKLPKINDEILDGPLCFAVANFCFFKEWENLAPARSAYQAYLEHSHFLESYIALLLSVCVLTSLFWLGLRWTRRKNLSGCFYLLHLVLILTLIFPLNFIRQSTGSAVNFPFFAFSYWFGKRGVLGVYPEPLSLVVISTGLIVFSLLVFRSARHYLHKTILAIRTILTLLIPFSIYTLAFASHQMVRQETLASKAPRTVAETVGSSNERVVWILFDEWDYRLSFPERPKDLKLPEFDRLRNESLFAENAVSPAGNTLLSMPSYLTGKRVEQLTFESKDRNIYVQNKGRPTRLAEVDSIFSETRKLGFKTALVGWFHAYCRMYHKDLNYCFREAMGSYKDVPFIMANMGNYFSRLGVLTTSASQHLESWKNIKRASLEVVANPAFGFEFLHLPIPHPPWIYDRALGKTSTYRHADAAGYFDNLVLADQTMGELRRTMEANGTWDTSTVIVTSDHHFRQDLNYDGKSDPRIPFLLKLPGKQLATTYKPAFNTVLIDELSLALLAGKLKTPKEVTAWIDDYVPPPHS